MPGVYGVEKHMFFLFFDDFTVGALLFITISNHK